MKVGEHRRFERAGAGPMGEVRAMMATYERPGLLERTVRSFLATAPGVGMTVFDDGSSSPEKKAELELVEGMGAAVERLNHGGFVETWLRAFEWARGRLEGLGGVVALEDDVTFASGWLDVLRRMHDGAAWMGMRPGAMTCLRVHSVPQATVVDLGGVEAYQSMGHGWQVNLLPWRVVADGKVQQEAAAGSRAGRHGIDVQLIGLMSHRLGMTSFSSTRSWARHDGTGRSVVKGQGFGAFEHEGFELVEELRKEGRG